MDGYATTTAQEAFPLDAAKIPVKAALDQSAAQLIAIEPFMLSFCEPGHFDAWGNILTSLDKKIDRLAFDRLKRSMRKPQFRLRDVMDQLERTQRFYS